MIGKKKERKKIYIYDLILKAGLESDKILLVFLQAKIDKI